MSDAALVRIARLLAAYAIVGAVVGGSLYVVLGFADLLVRNWVLHNTVGGLVVGGLVWVIVARQPRNGAVWALIVSAVFQATNVLALGLGQLQLVWFGLPADLAELVPAQLPLVTALTLQVTTVVWIPGVFVLLVHGLLLFPNGRYPSPGWRWVGRGAVAGMLAFASVAAWNARPASTLAIYADVPIAELQPAATAILVTGLAGIVAAVIATLAGLVRRYRRSTGLERQQFRWIVWAGTLFLVVTLWLLVSMAAPWVGHGLARAAIVVVMSVFFSAYIIAVARYRLYEIDRVVSRTALYGVVTAALGLTYLGLILGLQFVLSPFTAGSELAVAASTIVVAGAFRPVLVRARAMVDRRFNRAAYDARRTVEAFARRMRDDVDLGDVREQLTAVAATSVEPTRVSVWLLDDDAAAAAVRPAAQPPRA